MLPLSPRQAAENARFPWGDVFAFPNHALLLWAIPKAGCSGVKRWMLHHLEPGPEERWAPDVHTYSRPRYALGMREPDERDRLLNESLCVGFVREPVSRIVSAYVDKFVIRDHDNLFDPAREMTAVTGTCGVTFRRFVELLCDSPDDHLDVHWRPQAAFFAPARPGVIFPLERMNAALNAIGSAIGLPSLDLGKSNPTEYTRSNGTMLADTPSDVLKDRAVRPGPASLVDGEIRAKLASRYAGDLAIYRAAADTPIPDCAALMRQAPH